MSEDQSERDFHVRDVVEASRRTHLRQAKLLRELAKHQKNHAEEVARLRREVSRHADPETGEPVTQNIEPDLSGYDALIREAEECERAARALASLL